MAKKIAAYQAEDGTVFDTKQAAEMHDAKVARAVGIQVFVEQFVASLSEGDAAAGVTAEAVEQSLVKHLVENGETLAPHLVEPKQRKRRTKEEIAGGQQPAADAAGRVPPNGDSGADGGDQPNVDATPAPRFGFAENRA